MNDKLKPCPFCGHEIYTESYPEYYDGYCQNKRCFLYGKDLTFLDLEKWNTRPIENALHARIDELEAQLSEARARLAEYEAKSVVIKFMNEDELPKFINDDVYSAMFNCSHVDFVRLFPHIEENGQKYFLVMLKEDE